MKRIAVFLAEGFEEVEALTVVDVLRRANIYTDMISISNEICVNGAHNITVQADKIFSDISQDEYSMLVLPGGLPGATNLNNHSELKQMLIDFNSKNGAIAAICAAPMVLGEIGVLEGKKAICYPSFEEKLIGANISNKNVEVDGNVITGKGPAFAMEFALQIVEFFGGKDLRKTIEKGLLLR